MNTPLTYPYGEIQSEDQAKKLALAIARLGAGFVTPNPAVGCVILNQEKKLIGLGYHRKFGSDHAEVEALNDCISRSGCDALKNATVFVTLEPCGHVGKTQSCAHLLASFPLRTVVFGSSDPNPKVLGKGLEYLRSQNIKIAQDLIWAQETDRINAVFFHWIKHQTPYVAVKIATDFTECMGSRTTLPQKPTTITPKIIQLEAHALRQEYDAICVGIQTVFTDNPHLTNRSSNTPLTRNPIRIVLDPSDKMRKSEQSFNVLDLTLAPTIIVISPSNIPTDLSNEFSTLKIKMHDGHFDLPVLLKNLNEHFHIYSILVEGGARTLGEFFNQKCVHKLYQYKNLSNLCISNPIYWQDQIKVNFNLQPITNKLFPDQNCQLLEFQVEF